MSVGKDYPDWVTGYYTQMVHPLFDTGELAVRLGSIVSYDRRGAVVWLEGFDTGINHLTHIETGAYSDVLLVTTPVHHPPYGADIRVGTVTGSEAGIQKRLDVPYNERMGLCAAIAPSTNAQNVYLDMWRYYTSYVLLARVFISCPVRKLYATVAPGVTREIASGLPDYRAQGYHVFFKLVCDFENERYVRVLLGGVEYPLDAYAPWKVTGSFTPQVELDVIHRGNGPNAASCYVDNIIYTVAEP